MTYAVLVTSTDDGHPMYIGTCLAGDENVAGLCMICEEYIDCRGECPGCDRACATYKPATSRPGDYDSSGTDTGGLAGSKCDVEFHAVKLTEGDLEFARWNEQQRDNSQRAVFAAVAIPASLLATNRKNEHVCRVSPARAGGRSVPAVCSESPCRGAGDFYRSPLGEPFNFEPSDEHGSEHTP